MNLFRSFFEKEKIEYYASLPFAACEVLKPHLLPDGVKSAVVFLMPYYCGKGSEARNLSLYAVSRDYHLYFKQLKDRFLVHSAGVLPEKSVFGFCDNSPINEVKAAVTAGLGVIGENRLVINRRYGSYVFIGSFLLTVDVPPFGTGAKDEKHCIDCGNCKAACSFLRGESGVCLSMLNQKKNLTEEERIIVRTQKLRWGCDTCQEVCPMNHAAEKTPIDYFYQDRMEFVTPELIEEMPDDLFSQRAFSWRGKGTISRNL